MVNDGIRKAPPVRVFVRIVTSAAGTLRRGVTGGAESVNTRLVFIGDVNAAGENSITRLATLVLRRIHAVSGVPLVRSPKYKSLGPNRIPRHDHDTPKYSRDGWLVLRNVFLERYADHATPRIVSRVGDDVRK